MNPSSNVTRLLCFGDSNTWGRSGQNTDRYPANVRWTGLLQQKLGNTYEIVEEGLRSRTTNVDDQDPQFPGRNGFTYLQPCLESHQYLDTVILWLGTNDLKIKFNRQPMDIANALGSLIDLIHGISKNKNNQPTSILLISPPFVREDILKSNSQFAGAGPKSQELSGLLKQLATEKGTLFLDLAEFVEAGEFDGVHLEAVTHPIVAEKIYNVLQSI
jgi:lysophospholipase L1-like esterase